MKMRLSVFVGVLLSLASFSLFAQDHASPRRVRPKALLPQEVLREMEQALNNDKMVKEIQKQEELIKNVQSPKDLNLVKKELEWIQKKIKNHLDHLKSFSESHQGKLLPEEEKQLQALLKELWLRDLLVSYVLAKVSLKETEELAREADLALPPQLDPEIPKLFDETKVPKFIRPLPPVQPTIEPESSKSLKR